MPWTAKQLKLFRAAAHNPAISKSSGIKQADAERMSKEGLKKMAGGGRAVINKQDTKHGKMDMPFNKLNRFAGMKAGGMMKKGRRFNGESGSDVNDRLGEVGETKPRKKMSFASRFAMERGLGNKTFTYNGKEYNTELAKPKVDSRPFEKVPLNTAAIERRAKILSTGPNYEAAPRGRAVTRDEAMEERRAAQNTAAPGGSAPLADTMKRGGKVKRFAAGGMTKGGNVKKYAQGGMMKESKAMVGKEVNFMKKKGAPKSMIKHEAAEMGAMKKGGMPMKDGKPAFMQKKMMGGGMAKYAKGGGIESKGKTKGTMIKMAAGGIVKFAKGGGIESKGKTKGTMIKMQGC